MILIVGATGVLGGLITKKLLAEGNSVRILVRHNSPAEQMALQGMATSAKDLIEAGAIPIYGDIKDRKSLDLACKEIDTIITTANSAMRGGEDNVDTVDRQGNSNLIEAAKAAKVKQFIFISFLGADLNHPVPLFQAKAETEAKLIESGLVYTILSPNFFMESWIGMVVGIPLQAHQPITLVGKGQRLHSLISIGDVAAFASAVIGNTGALNQKIILGGPSPVSWCDIVDAFGKMLGQSLSVNFVKMGEPLPGLPDIVTAVLTGMETYDSPVPMAGVADHFNVKQATLDTVVQRMLTMPGG